MGIVKDAELRKGKAELARALAAKGVAAMPYERLDALAAKVAGVSGGGEPGGAPERFGNVVLVPPLPALTVATSLTPPPTTWNPNDKNAGITLSNENLTATIATGAGSVRATKAHTEGKKYFEVLFVTASVAVGVCGIETTTATGRLGDMGAGSSPAIFYEAGRIYQNTAPDLFENISAPAAGSVIGVAVDIDSGTVQFYKNNVLFGQLYTGVKPAIAAVYPIISLNGLSQSATARFAAASFTFAPPAGYSAWDS